MVDAAPLNRCDDTSLHVGAPELLPVHLSLRGVDYFVPTGWRREKQILFGVDADMRPGQLTAVMGPSGAGKTTVLNLLSQNAAGRIVGSVSANGRPLPRNTKTFVNIVPQDDVLLPALSVRETLTYAAALRMPRGGGRQARVMELVDALGLDECVDVPVGSVDRRGISGGQRKRVSIALELFARPSVLFMDEPTSGLDSKAAEDIVGMVSRIAAQGHTVACTIHQPSWTLFSLFHSLLLLSKGRAVCHGEPAEAPAHFARLGHPAPPNQNPVDHILRVIQEAEFAPADPLPAEGAGLPEVPSGRRYQTSAPHQVGVLLRRNVYDQVRDTTKFAAICALKLGVSVLIGVCWWSSASPADWTQAFSITGCLFMLCMQTIMNNVFNTVIRFPLSKALFLREYRNGAYSSLAWCFAYIGHIILLETFYSLLLCAPAYFMIGLRREVFPVALLNIFLGSCIGSTLGILVGTLSKDLQHAQGMMIPVLIPLLLFSGYTIPVQNINYALRWIYYIDPFQWSFSIMRLNQFDGWVFDACPRPGELAAPFCVCTPEHPRCTGRDYLVNVADLDPDSHPMYLYFAYLGCFFAAALVPTFLAIVLKGTAKTG